MWIKILYGSKNLLRSIEASISFPQFYSICQWELGINTLKITKMVFLQHIYLLYYDNYIISWRCQYASQYFYLRHHRSHKLFCSSSVKPAQGSIISYCRFSVITFYPIYRSSLDWGQEEIHWYYYNNQLNYFSTPKSRRYECLWDNYSLLLLILTIVESI